MNKLDLAVYVARKTGLFQKDALAIIDCLTRTIQEALAKRDEVIIRNLGKFETKERSARKIRNVVTGKEIEIPAHRVPFFKSSQKLKDRCNKKHKEEMTKPE
jgi:DNA-binding protein HU-beta